ncbi:hypothetical protein [Nocardioides sp. KR10-350]|uniref:hypothetical protein n=1 Tax=Nocardioides cheoyonin TaxID=3156615 RepID=UPI0032B50556
MSPAGLAVLVVAAVAVGALMGLTIAGERRRARGWGAAVVAGMFFPVTWTVWYVRDVRPYAVGRRG